MCRRLFAREQILRGAVVAAVILGGRLWVAPADSDPSSHSDANWSGRERAYLRQAASTPSLRRLMSDDELGRRIAVVSSRYLGTAYQRDPLGEGPNASVDRDPL